MSKETLKVSGMTCGHCVSTVESSVGELNGVSQVKVNLQEGTVDVEFDSAVVSLDNIKSTIDDQGYDVVA
ncbi:MAG: copper chaperone CopZ [Bacilli bacterium]